MDDHLPTLRLLAGYSNDAEAARAYGVTRRTWRRWRQNGAPRLVMRLLRYEAGMVPGWPPGWRVRREGVEIPGLGLQTLPMIEARGWVWSLVRDGATVPARSPRRLSHG